MVTAAGHIIFAAAYIFFLLVYSGNDSISMIYPLYLVPFAVYGVIASFSGVAAYFTDEKFCIWFRRISKALFVFLLLFAAPLIIKFNIPEPHNFIQRKFELVLGASYALFVLGAAGVMLRKFIAGREMEKLSTKKIFIFVLVSFFAFYFSLSMWMNYANQPTGDEPVYVLVAHSLVFDRDVDLANNYSDKDYKKFYKHRELESQMTDVQKDGKLYSYHPVMLSLLISPLYLIGGRLGVTIGINLAAALVIALIFYLLMMVFKEKHTAFITAVITGFSMPLIGFSNIISTEIISGAFIIAAYILIKKKRVDIFALSAVMAILFWLHVRNFLIFGSLGLLFLHENRKDIKLIAIFVITQLISGVLYAVVNISKFGSILPSYGGDSNASRFQFHNIKGMFVMFMDEQTGLFTFMPVMVLIIAGILFMYRQNRKTLYELLVIFIPYFILITSWDDWGIGNASPRYFVPVMFVFSLLLGAVVFNAREKGSVMLIRILSAAGYVMSAAIICIPWFRWDSRSGGNSIFDVIEKLSHMNLAYIFPSIRNGTPWVSVAVWCMVIIAVNAYIISKGSVSQK